MSFGGPGISCCKPNWSLTISIASYSTLSKHKKSCCSAIPKVMWQIMWNSHGWPLFKMAQKRRFNVQLTVLIFINKQIIKKIKDILLDILICDQIKVCMI